MIDMRPTIVPKSDQLNADDLIAGPITVRITDVTVRPGTEQPVSIFYENDNGKPYKCCKSMARVMVSAWGPDAKAYIGRGLTLYRDPKVKWGGLEVGGIRISHMTDIASTMVLALTETKQSRKPFTVKPLVIEKTEPKKADVQARLTTREAAEIGLSDIIKDEIAACLNAAMLATWEADFDRHTARCPAAWLPAIRDQVRIRAEEIDAEATQGSPT